MSTICYPGFYYLNHPESESSLASDQVIPAYPSSNGAAWQDDLMATLLFEQFVTFSEQHNNDVASMPTGEIPSIQQMTPVPELTPPTQRITEPVRLKHTHPRVLHACDYCRYRKTKCSGEQPVCSSCKRKGRTCTWTPIKLMKNRLSRKRSELHQPLPHAHKQNAYTGLEQPYFMTQMPTYPSTTDTNTHGGTSLGTAMHDQIFGTPPSAPFASQVPIVDEDWSGFPGVTHFLQEWVMPSSSNSPCFNNLSSGSSHEALPRVHQGLYSDSHSPIINSSSSVKSATKQCRHPGYATRSHVPA